MDSTPARSLELQDRVRQFMLAHVEPVEELHYEQGEAGSRALQDAADAEPSA